MNFASSLVLVMLTAGCASGAARSAEARNPVSPAARQARQTSPGERRQVELRHFYLLSPGPNATLVVTRSDVSSSDPADERDVGNLHQHD